MSAASSVKEYKQKAGTVYCEYTFVKADGCYSGRFSQKGITNADKGCTESRDCRKEEIEKCKYMAKAVSGASVITLSGAVMGVALLIASHSWLTLSRDAFKT